MQDGLDSLHEIAGGVCLETLTEYKAWIGLLSAVTTVLPTIRKFLSD